MAQKTSFLIDIPTYKIIKKKLTPSQCGQLVNLIAELAEMIGNDTISATELECFTIPDSGENDPALEVAYQVLAQKVVADTLKYKRTCEKNRNNGEQHRPQATASDSNRPPPTASDRGGIGKDRIGQEKDCYGLSLDVLTAARETGFEISPPFARSVSDLISEFGEDAIIQAMETANLYSSPQQDKRTLAYLRAVCRNARDDAERTDLDRGLENWDL